MTAQILLKRFWPYMAGALLLGGVILWHKDKVSDAREAGRAEQAQIDAIAFQEAARRATEAQQAAIAKVKANSAAINKETTDALTKRNTDLARSYDDLRLRWAKAKADSSSADEGGATAVSDAAAGTIDAACAARGWVDFGTAATLAEAADRATAKDDAWRAWWTAQEAAWPD